MQDPEIHDIKDLKPRNDNGALAIWKVLSVVIALLGGAYAVSPIDVVPDAIPVLGWLDDIGVAAVAMLNLYQQFAKDQGAALVKLVRYAKWILVLLIVISCFAFAGLVFIGVEIFSQISK